MLFYLHERLKPLPYLFTFVQQISDLDSKIKNY